MAHVQLQPVHRCVQLNLHALAHHGHLWLGHFHLLCFEVLAEQRRELIKEDLPDGQTQLGILPRLELVLKLLEHVAICIQRFVRDFAVDLDISVM